MAEAGRSQKLPEAAPAGYSGTPLARKLGYRAGTVAATVNAPPPYRTWLEPLPEGVRFLPAPTAKAELVHVFSAERAFLAQQLQALRQGCRPDAAVWVSWPKKAAKVPTDITEDTVRELALPLGFVDIKVCAVSEVWSGLKLVVRKELRGG